MAGLSPHPGAGSTHHELLPDVLSRARQQQPAIQHTTSNSPPNTSTAKMPPRKREQTPATTAPVVTSTPQVSRPSTSSKNTSSAQQIVDGIWKNYVNKTPQRVKLLDAFMAFLAVVGALQFVYCVIVGNFVSPLLVHDPTIGVPWADGG